MRWAEVIRQCKALDYRSHDTSTCGLHIHIGRRGLGADNTTRDTAVANLVLLVDTLWSNIVPFTRRSADNLERWAERPVLYPYTCTVVPGQGFVETPLDMNSDEGLRTSALNTVQRGRYQAVNLCNACTVELRIFRGTLKRNTLIASIQLANNLAKYAMTHTPMECRNAKWSDVIAVEQFRELTEYCREKGLN
jgi:hypothetical protein